MVQYLTDEEIKMRRKYLLKEADKKTIISKGDRRVGGSRLCAICGKKLSTTIISNQTTKSVSDHYRLYFSDLISISLCKRIGSCKREMTKHKEGQETYVNGR